LRGLLGPFYQCYCLHRHLIALILTL
jgi:hypothetical protein